MVEYYARKNDIEPLLQKLLSDETTDSLGRQNNLHILYRESDKEGLVKSINIKRQGTKVRLDYPCIVIQVIRESRVPEITHSYSVKYNYRVYFYLLFTPRTDMQYNGVKYYAGEEVDESTNDNSLPDMTMGALETIFFNRIGYSHDDFPYIALGENILVGTSPIERAFGDEENFGYVMEYYIQATKDRSMIQRGET